MKRITLTAITIFLTINAFAQLNITSVTPTTSTTVGRYEKFEVGLQLSQTSFNNVYNPDEIDIWATFTGPFGQTYNVNAFWYQPFNRCTNCPDPTVNHTFPTGEICAHDKAIADPNYLTMSPTNNLPWRIRFAPNKIGNWTYVVTVRYQGIETMSPVQNFNAVSSQNKGYVQIGNNGMSFKYLDGSLYYPMGINEIGNGLSTVDIYNRAMHETDIDFINKMESVGATLLRLNMGPHAYSLEWGTSNTTWNVLGNYSARQNRAFDLDDVVAYANNHNVKIQLCILDNGEFSNPNWVNNPYRLGLPSVNSIIDFYTAPDAKEQFKKKLRYIMARWGYATSISAFEMMNEAENHFPTYWSNDQLVIRDWHDEMISYCKFLDNNNHLFTTSTASASAEYFSHNPGMELFLSPELDFLNGHFYSTDYNSTHQMHYLHKIAKERYSSVGKPYFFGEFGPSHPTSCWIGNSSFYTTSTYTPGNYIHDKNLEHNNFWTNAVSTGAGVGATWDRDLFNNCWGGSYRYFEPIAKFIENETIYQEDYKIISNPCSGPAGPKDDPRQAYPPVQVNAPYCIPGWAMSDGTDHFPNLLKLGVKTTDDQKVEVFGLKSDNKIIGWIHHKGNYWYNLEHQIGPNPTNLPCSDLNDNQNPYNPNIIQPIEDFQVTLTDLCFGTYKVEFYSTYPGFDVDNDGTLDNGGIIPAYTINNLHTDCGDLTFEVPDLNMLGRTPLELPDYAFKVTKTGGAWVHKYLNQHPIGYDDFSGNKPGNVIVTTADNHIFYKGSDDKLYKLTPTSNTTWDLELLWSNSSQNVKGSIAVDPNNHTHAFYRGFDNKLHHYYWDHPIEWKHTVHTDPNNNSQDVAGDIAVGGGASHVFYKGADSKLHHYYWDNTINQWTHVWLTNWSNNSQDVGGDIAVSKDAKHVFYQGLDDKLHHYYWSPPNQWTHIVHTDWNNNSQDVDGDIAIADDNAQHVFYRGADNRLHHYYWSPPNQWTHIWHTNWNNNSENVDWASEVTADNNHVFYVGYAGQINHLYYDFSNSSWTHDYIICDGDIRQEYFAHSSGNIYCSADDRVFYRGHDNYLHAYIFDAGCQRIPDNDQTGHKPGKQNQDSNVTLDSAQLNYLTKNHEQSHKDTFSNNLNDTISIYPVPFSDIVFVSGPMENIGTISIYNMYGQKVLEHIADNTQHEVKLTTTNLPQGTYIIYVKDKFGHAIDKRKISKL